MNCHFSRSTLSSSPFPLPPTYTHTLRAHAHTHTHTHCMHTHIFHVNLSVCVCVLSIHVVVYYISILWFYHLCIYTYTRTVCIYMCMSVDMCICVDMCYMYVCNYIVGTPHEAFIRFHENLLSFLEDFVVHCRMPLLPLLQPILRKMAIEVSEFPQFRVHSNCAVIYSVNIVLYLHFY